MPSKNTVKEFDADQMWHVYNRGVEKRMIFMDDLDYRVFLSYLKIALGPEIPKEAVNLDLAQVFNLRRAHLHSEVELVAYCLMPNHFHLLLYQYSPDGISKLMRSISTGYVMYFNKRYKREGRLFQGTYKASHINSDKYWLHATRYLHLNPLDVKEDYRAYPYSSYKYFAGRQAPKWLHPEWATKSFVGTEEYRTFVADYQAYKHELDSLKKQLAD